jgi:hypothetical protein
MRGLLVLTVLLFGAPAWAVPIFDSFGPGDTYQTGIGFGLGTYADHTNAIQGFSFTPVGGPFFLDTVEVAAGALDEPNGLLLWLMTDKGGAPGSVIEAFTIPDLVVDFAGSIVSADSLLHPTLEAGTQYWLMGSASGPGEVVWLSVAHWNVRATASDQGLPPAPITWSLLQTSNYGAFRLSGRVVPEPATALLLACGLAGLAAIRRRR